MLKKLKDFAVLTFAVTLVAAGVYFFKIPNGFSTGGVSGVATILGHLLDFTTPATVILVINVSLLLVSFIFLGRDFGARSVYCTLVFSGEIMLFERVLPLSAPLTDEPLLELCYAMLLTAVGSAILFNSSASTGGTDIAAMILKKYTPVNTGTALFISDALVALSSVLVFGIKTGLFSILGLFMKAFVVDGVIESVNLCKCFTVITTKPDEISAYVFNTLHHGVTMYDATGVFTHERRSVLLTVCRRGEAVRLRKRIKELDPASFVIITNSSEIIGRGFRSL